MYDGSFQSSMQDFDPATATFFQDVVVGLSASNKYLPCKYLYDRRGSQLFDKICGLEEYYVARSELTITRRFGAEMTAQIGAGAMLVEYGSGSSVKTRSLLDRLEDPVAYVPIDISYEQLQQSAAKLSRIFPHIEVLPVCADFTANFDLPISNRRPTHVACYFPGSTIGNFPPVDAALLLGRIADLCATEGGLLIGIDLKKDVRKFEAAYNDQQGVTAEFNVNLLHRINRELDADFQLDQFRHRAVYNAAQGRVEMHLFSRRKQVVSIGERSFDFAADESICTEYSYKYTIDEFEAIAANVGLSLHRYWTDSLQNFAVLYLAVDD